MLNELCDAINHFKTLTLLPTNQVGNVHLQRMISKVESEIKHLEFMAWLHMNNHIHTHRPEIIRRVYCKEQI